jgi:hypothetical protein
MSHSWSGLSSTVTVPELTDFIRHASQSMQGFAQLCNMPTGEALGRGRGDTVQYTFFPDISTTGGVLAESEEFPEGSLVPVSGSYVIQEYGNAITMTLKLKELSRLPIEDGLVQALINDMRKAQNTAAYTEFDSTSWIATFNSVADEFRTDGVAASFTNVANEQLSLANLRYLVRKARSNLIPYFDGESYVFISGVNSLDALKYDSAVTDLLKYDSGRAALNGECGRIAMCRLVEDNHKIAVVGGSSTGAGAELETGYLIGADAVVNEYALAPEVRADDKDLGRRVKVAWYFMAAWKKIYNQTSHSKEHVIKVTSK